LKHLIQLTEYVTGLNARIGYPNEHLVGGHIEELAKPMYSTCIGLILKGYNDYENSNPGLQNTFIKITAPGQEEEQQDTVNENVEELAPTQLQPRVVKQRKSLKHFMDSFKIGLIDLFKEEEDTQLK
jgi:cell division protein FtsA